MLPATPFNDRVPDLSTAEGVRSAMRYSYEWHLDLAGTVNLPGGTTRHEAALFGVLSSYYEAQGQRPPQTVGQENAYWLDLLPFTELPEEDGLEPLIEYIIWKHQVEPGAVNVEWLAEKIRSGARRAIEAGLEEQMRVAADIGGHGPLPWVRMLGGG